MEKMMPDEINEIEIVMLEQDVIALHDVARHIEKTIGQGQLSDDIRAAADRLAQLLQRY
jgi:hypothetical protein